jgi:hypothetical protein
MQDAPNQSEKLTACVNDHKQQAKFYEQERGAHERQKKRHYERMVQLELSRSA